MPHTSQSTSPNCTDEASTNNKTYFHREPLEGTPFEIIGTPNDGFFIALAGRRISAFATTIPEAKLLQYSDQWNITLNCIALIIEANEAQKNYIPNPIPQL